MRRIILARRVTDSSRSSSPPAPSCSPPAATTEETPGAPARRSRGHRGRANEFLPEGCENVEKPAPKDGRATIKKPTEKLDTSKTLRRHGRRRPAATSRSRSTPSSAPKTGGSFKSLADAGVLRRHDLPPHRARLRDPGRRPGRRRHRRPGLLRRGGAARATSTYTKGVVAMAKTGTEPAGTSGSQFFVVTGERTPRCRPTTRCSARSPRAWRSSTRSARPGRPDAGQPADPVVIKSITVTRGVARTPSSSSSARLRSGPPP